MKIGTKSILFGAHQFALHPVLVFIAWWKLYGFPWDPRLWVAFLVHDLGYWGMPNMDGPEGENHVFLGAQIMGAFDDHPLHRFRLFPALCDFVLGHIMHTKVRYISWYYLTFYHSRFMSKRYGARPSKLCAADKLAFCLHPKWLYILQTTLSGELDEFMNRDHHGKGGKYEADKINTSSRSQFVDSTRAYLRKWAEENK